MIFEVEKKEPQSVEKFALIEKALRSLKSYGPQSYAILTNQEGDYVQVAGGRVTCMVEYKSGGETVRAFLDAPKVNFNGPHELAFGAGKVTLEPDEFLFIDDVVAIFSSFFNSQKFPEYIKWRTKCY